MNTPIAVEQLRQNGHSDANRARILRDAALVLGALAAEERFYPMSEHAANDVMAIARQLQGMTP